VRPLTVAEVEEAVDVRKVLEGLAADLAARRSTPKMIKELERNLELFAQALASQDETALLELNGRFHDRIYRAANSRLLYRLLSELQDEVERVSRHIMSNMAAGAWSLEDHRDLLAALKAGDAVLASQAAAAHVERGGRWYLSQLKGIEKET
jgi:DNA-binding GntR family transcriptional regulator